MNPKTYFNWNPNNGKIDLRVTEISFIGSNETHC